MPVLPAGLRRSTATGLGLAVFSAATFGSSGSFAAALLATGWTPGAAVLARIALAALALTVPAVLAMRGRWQLLRTDAAPVLGYGVFAIGVAQLCYFNAVEHLSVAVALLLEYSGTLLVVGWMWLRHGQAPRRLTVVGGLVALVGLALVLDITGDQHLSLVGVLWGLGAAVGLAAYFVLSAGPSGRAADEGLPPIAMAWAGMVVAAVALAVMGAVGAMPMRAATADVTLAGARTSWLVPVLGVALVAGALAYTTGIGAARVLGARLSSFVGLAEVLAATLFAWGLLGQRPGVLQAVGGVVVLVGIALVKADERLTESATPELPVVDLPDAPAADGPHGQRRRGSARALAGRLHRAARPHGVRPRRSVGAPRGAGRGAGVDRPALRSARR